MIRSCLTKLLFISRTVRLTGVDRRWTVVETSNPGLEQMILCTPSGTVHPLCSLSIPKEMADVMEVLLLISGGDVVVVESFVGTVMDDMGLVLGGGGVSEERRRACECDCGCLDPEVELLLELLLLLTLGFLFSFARGILPRGGVLGRNCCCCC